MTRHLRSSIELDSPVGGLPGWKVRVDLPGYTGPVRRRFAFARAAMQEETARARAEGFRDGVIAMWQRGGPA